MDFLDNLVLPQSAEHIALLHYILMMILFLYIPFISVLFGGTILSLWYRKRGLNESNPMYLRFAIDIIETLTINKSIGVILGIVPTFVFVLIFAQLLHNTETPALVYMITAFAFSIIAIILIYTYRYSVTFGRLFESLKEAVPEDEDTSVLLRNYRDGSRRIGTRSGRYGVIFLFLALYLIVAGISVTTYSSGANGIYQNLISIKIILRFIQFLTASAALTGGAIFFAYFAWDGGKKITDEKHKTFIKKNAVYLTFTGSILLPVLLCMDIIILPETALSGAIFVYGLLALFLLFIVYHYLYSMIRDSNLKFSSSIFYLVLVSLLALIVKDQLAMGNALKPNAVILSSKYDVYLAGLEGGNKGAATVSGEQIFKNICSSCHSFDHKVVGPPYKQTLPKYEGHLNQLVSFIRNPTKKNPDYPPMPNPGLKPNEAQAVAEWILKTYKTK